VIGARRRQIEKKKRMEGEVILVVEKETSN
jgi:hypothetical protein